MSKNWPYSSNFSFLNTNHDFLREYGLALLLPAYVLTHSMGYDNDSWIAHHKTHAELMHVCPASHLHKLQQDSWSDNGEIQMKPANGQKKNILIISTFQSQIMWIDDISIR